MNRSHTTDSTQAAASMLVSALFAIAIALPPQILCGQEERKAAKPSEQNDSIQLPELRDELANRVQQDQKARFAMIESMKSAEDSGRSAKLVKALADIDQDNTRWLRQQVAQHGWLGKSLVGREGAHDAWLLVQHADKSPDFQRKCLELMGDMVSGEVDPVDLAYLTDRVLAAADRPQRFGTQCTIVDGKASIKNVEDPENLNQRRAAIGLEPIEDYLGKVEQMYAGQASADKPAQESATHESQEPAADNATAESTPSARAAAKLEQLAWISGHWQGEAMGGKFEETWNPPFGGSMMGMFKFVEDGEVKFYELLTIVEADDSLVLRLKHFDKSLNGWEEKDASVEFPLIQLTATEAVFDGLTFRKVDEGSLKIIVKNEQADGKVAELVFNCRRARQP